MTQAKLDLTAMLAAQTQGRHFGPQAPEAYDKPTNIVVAGNGVFRVVKTPVALFTTKLTDIPAASRIPGLADMKEGPELLIPKIPLKYLIMVLTWYKDVHKKDGTEASILFFWNHSNEPVPTHWEPTQAQRNLGIQGDPIKGLVEDGQLIIYCPTQKNSGSLSEFHEDTLVPYLRENFTPLCETHSHHTMDAFWSGTDNANENMTQFYGVWGKINDAEPKFLFRWVCGEKKIDIDPSILFDIPQVEIKTVVTTTVPVDGFEPQVEEKIEYKAYKGPWQRVEAPEDWMGQHRKSWGGYQYSGGSQYGKKNHVTQAGGGSNSPSYAGTAGQFYDDGYDEEYGYGLVGGAHLYGQRTGYQDPIEASTTSKKKEVSEDVKTTVEIFMKKAIDAGESIAEIEDTVRLVIEELIDYGYDHVISDTMQESSSYAKGWDGRLY